MATHISILAWRIPWTEEAGRLQSMGSQRVRHNWATNTHMKPERKKKKKKERNSWISITCNGKSQHSSTYIYFVKLRMNDNHCFWSSQTLAMDKIKYIVKGISFQFKIAIKHLGEWIKAFSFQFHIWVILSQREVSYAFLGINFLYLWYKDTILKVIYKNIKRILFFMELKHSHGQWEYWQKAEIKFKVVSFHILLLSVFSLSLFLEKEHSNNLRL